MGLRLVPSGQLFAGAGIDMEDPHLAAWGKYSDDMHRSPVDKTGFRRQDPAAGLFPDASDRTVQILISNTLFRVLSVGGWKHPFLRVMLLGEGGRQGQRSAEQRHRRKDVSFIDHHQTSLLGSS